jgi:hypothetical protein
MEFDKYTSVHLKCLFQKCLSHAAKAITVVDPSLRPKRFKQHVKYETSEHDLIWGRDRWTKLESLPIEYRTLINEDKESPDQTLIVCCDLWQKECDDYMTNMQQIAEYGRRYKRGPDFIETIKTSDNPLKYHNDVEKILNYLQSWYDMSEQHLIEEEELRKQKAMAEEESRRKAIDRRRCVGGSGFTTMHYFTTRAGTALTKVKMLDTSGLRPHEIQKLKEAGIKPLSFVSHNVPVMLDKKAPPLPDPDTLPPVKIHPIHLKRGRNS